VAGRLVVWPSPIIQMSAGAGLIGFGAVNILDVLALTGATDAARVGFTVMFSVFILLGVRFLGVRAVVSSAHVDLVGVLTRRRMSRARVVQVVFIDLGSSFSHVELVGSDGTRLEAPMALRASARMARRVAHDLADELSVPLEK
jgi:hypothetical protein